MATWSQPDMKRAFSKHNCWLWIEAVRGRITRLIWAEEICRVKFSETRRPNNRTMALSLYLYDSCSTNNTPQLQVLQRHTELAQLHNVRQTDCVMSKGARLIRARQACCSTIPLCWSDTDLTQFNSQTQGQTLEFARLWNAMKYINSITCSVELLPPSSYKNCWCVNNVTGSNIFGVACSSYRSLHLRYRWYQWVSMGTLSQTVLQKL